MRERFHAIAEFLSSSIRGSEEFTATLHGEESDFVRWTRGRIRQAGSVIRATLGVDWIEGRRHAAATVELSGDEDLDAARLRALVPELRERRAELADDPHLLLPDVVRSTDDVQPNRLPDPGAALDAIARAAGGHDLVGIWAAGPTYSGFASSSGQRNWHTDFTFNLDWTFYAGADKAVKETYAGREWSAAELERRATAAGARLEALSRPPRTIHPGGYRVFLAPAAVDEIAGVLGWGGFGLRAHRTKTTPLLAMIEEGRRLHSSIDFIENAAEGLAPPFQEAGFLRPPRVTLVEGGTYRNCLVSPRSAAEYGAEPNGASADESPRSFDVSAGTLATDRALDELGRGVWVSNLHYLNYSDRSACRMTGITRFATFWVEGGEIVAPLAVMRFDETLYRIFGENLVALTSERETLLDPTTYGGRATRSTRLPGALVEDFRLTL